MSELSKMPKRDASPAVEKGVANATSSLYTGITAPKPLIPGIPTKNATDKSEDATNTSVLTWIETVATETHTTSNLPDEAVDETQASPAVDMSTPSPGHIEIGESAGGREMTSLVNKSSVPSKEVSGNKVAADNITSLDAADGEEKEKEASTVKESPRKRNKRGTARIKPKPKTLIQNAAVKKSVKKGKKKQPPVNKDGLIFPGLV